MSKSVLSQKLEASPETKHNGRVSFNRSHGKHITRGCQLCSAHITESLQCETPNNSSALACHLLARKTVFVLQALNVSSSYMMGRACITIRAVKNSSLPCDVQRKEVRKLLVWEYETCLAFLEIHNVLYIKSCQKIIYFHKKKKLFWKLATDVNLKIQFQFFSCCQLFVFTKSIPSTPMTCIWNKLSAPTSTIDTDAKNLN